MIPNTRRRKDGLKMVTTAFPAQDTTANAVAIDLEAVRPFPTTEGIALEIDVPAMPDLANTQTATFTVQDSADGSTFAALAGVDTFVRTGAGGVGVAAGSKVYRLPDHTRRYVRVSVAMSATTGDNTAVKYTAALKF